MTETPEAMMETITPSHEYHAEAHVLSGELKRPVEQKIEQHAPVALRDYRGGHLTRFTEDVSIEGLVRFKAGHTRVSGSRSLKHKGWVTLSTSIIEGLNVFEVITADRLVAQISTEHAYENGHVPHVSFLGTKFINLELSGYPLKLNLDFGVCGAKPEGDKPYLQDASFQQRAGQQIESVLEMNEISPEARARYHESLTTLNTLSKNRNGGLDAIRDKTHVLCSLVKSIEVDRIPIPGLKTRGNVLVIPEFGTVALGEVEVGLEPPNGGGEGRAYDRRENGGVESGHSRPSNYFTIRMVRMNLGCVGHGDVVAGSGTANGHTRP